MGRSTLPESGEVLTHQLLNFRKTGIARTPSMTGMISYLAIGTTQLSAAFYRCTWVGQQQERKLYHKTAIKGGKR